MGYYHRYHKGTKSNIVYHSVMFILYSSCVTVALINLAYSIVMGGGDKFASLFCIFFISMPALLHKSEINDCLDSYVGSAKHRLSSKKPNIIDKYISFLINHYNKRWTPAQFVCCSFLHLDPKVSHESLDLSLVAKYKISENSDIYHSLYQCKKCHKLIYAIEPKSSEPSYFVYIPVKNEADLLQHRKDWDSSRKTFRTKLCGYDDFWYWENKDLKGEIWQE